MSEKSILSRPNPAAGPVVQRQGAIRYAPNAKTTAQINGFVQPAQEAVKVLDISATGVSLLLSRTLEQGVLLVVELCNPEEGITRLQLVRVVHVQELTPHNYVIGCSFANKLSGDDIQAFLA